MKIKNRFLSAFVATVMMCSLIPFSVSAATARLSLTLNTVFDFDTVGSGATADDIYGKCHVLAPGDANVTTLSFAANPIANGEYILSFDFKMSDKNNLNLYGHNTAEARTKYGVPLQPPPFMSSQSSQVAKSFKLGEWQHHDLLFNAQENVLTLDWFIDGSKVITMDLTKNSLYELENILLQATGSADAEKSRFDNICFRENQDMVSGTIKYQRDNTFLVSYPEMIQDMTEEDMVLVREPIDGGAEEPVDFTVINSTPTSFTLEPDDFVADGYKYIFRIAKDEENNPVKTTVFGNAIGDASLELPASAVVEKVWDYENETSTSATRSIVEEEYRGKVEEWSGGGNRRFLLDSALTYGRYLLSYDIKRTATDGTGELLTIDTMSSSAATNYGFFQYLKDDNKLYRKSRQESSEISSSEFTTGDWYRVDNVLNLDTKKADVYIDGEYVGEAELWDSKDNTNAIDTFMGARFAWKTGGSLDNISIKTFSGDFTAKASGKEDIIYIDFNETIPVLTADNFKVKRGNTLLSDMSEESFEIVYSSGTRVALKINSMLNSGEYVAVEFDGIKSVFSKKLSMNEATFCVSDGQSSTISNIAFVGADGKSTDVRNVASATKDIVISFSNGLLNDEVNGTISLTDANDEPVDFTEYYNAEDKTLTLELDKLLGAGQSYKLVLSGIADEAGVEYQALSGDIQTGEAQLELFDVTVSRTSTGAQTSVKCINTKDDLVSYYVILVGYNGNEMEYTNVQKVEIAKDEANIEQQVTFDDAGIHGCERISSFVWKSYEDIKPITGSMEIQ